MIIFFSFLLGFLCSTILLNYLINRNLSNELKFNKLKCIFLGHPWEWVHFYKTEEKSGMDAYCRLCGTKLNKYPHLRAFTGQHEEDHRWGCEIKDL